MAIDRTELNRALAKSLACADCGQHSAAASSAFTLLALLDEAGIINFVQVGDMHVVERPERAG